MKKIKYVGFCLDNNVLNRAFLPVIILLILSVYSINSWAAVAVKAAETYSATVGNGTAEEISPQTFSSMGKEESSDDNLIKKVVKKEEVVQTVEATNGFDMVPDDKKEEVAARIKFSYDILKRFGRAYDYRTTTLKEFKNILAVLEKSEKKEQDSKEQATASSGVSI